jgi:hypothetical protein
LEVEAKAKLKPEVRSQAEMALEIRSKGKVKTGLGSESEKKGDAEEESETRLNYKRLYVIAPEILDGECHYMKLQVEGQNDLVLVQSGSQIRMTQYYEQNGDLMHDPEIVLEVDKDKRMINPISFRQDGMGVYDTVDRMSQKKVQELEEFLSYWLLTVQVQGFRVVEKRVCFEMSGYEEENEWEEAELEVGG